MSPFMRTKLHRSVGENEVDKKPWNKGYGLGEGQRVPHSIHQFPSDVCAPASQDQLNSIE